MHVWRTGNARSWQALVGWRAPAPTLMRDKQAACLLADGAGLDWRLEPSRSTSTQPALWNSMGTQQWACFGLWLPDQQTALLIKGAGSVPGPGRASLMQPAQSIHSGHVQALACERLGHAAGVRGGTRPGFCSLPRVQSCGKLGGPSHRRWGRPEQRPHHQGPDAGRFHRHVRLHACRHLRGARSAPLVGGCTTELCGRL